MLTALLAPRCDTLLACDAVPEAVASAGARTAGLPGVRVEQRAIPGQWPAGSFDLIVLSELLYYFGDADLGQVLGLAIGSLRPGGQLLAVHWRHPAPDHPRTGDAVHEDLAAHPALARLAGYRDPDFTAEVYARAAVTASGTTSQASRRSHRGASSAVSTPIEQPGSNAAP